MFKELNALSKNRIVMKVSAERLVSQLKLKRI